METKATKKAYDFNAHIERALKKHKNARLVVVKLQREKVSFNNKYKVHVTTQDGSIGSFIPYAQVRDKLQLMNSCFARAIYYPNPGGLEILDVCEGWE